MAARPIVLPCAIDADESETILAAYKFNGTDFLVRDFINLTLEGKSEQTTEQATTNAPETVIDASTTAPVTDAEPSGCKAMLGGVGIVSVPVLALALAAAWVLDTKK